MNSTSFPTAFLYGFGSQPLRRSWAKIVPDQIEA
jgi:hypothetical protein